KTYAGGSAEIRSAEELVNRQSLAARERIALEAAHIDNAGVIEAGVEPDERRNARGDLELRSGTLRNAGSLVASRALEAKASQALDNQGGSLKGATVRVDAGHLNNRGGKLLAEGELRVEASSLDNRQDGLLQSRDRAVVKTRGDLDNRGGQVIGLNDLEVGAATLDNGQQGLLGSQQSTRVSAQALVNRGDGEVSGKRVEARVGSLDNRGGKLIGDDLLVVASGAIDNRLGLFSAANRLDLRARSLDNSGKGTLSSRGGLEVSLGGLLDNRDEGNLLSQGAQRVTVGQLDNRAGGLLWRTGQPGEPGPSRRHARQQPVRADRREWRHRYRGAAGRQPRRRDFQHLEGRRERPRATGQPRRQGHRRQRPAPHRAAPAEPGQGGAGRARRPEPGRRRTVQR
ncbi:hypothetical protein IPC1236_12715, partial [Pseudomonas aeruginosa]